MAEFGDGEQPFALGQEVWLMDEGSDEGEQFFAIIPGGEGFDDFPGGEAAPTAGGDHEEGGQYAL